MRILLVTQYFYPENFKSNDIAFELVKLGHKVDALVGIPNYPEGKYYNGYGIFNKRIENINGVNIYRSFQFPRGKGSGIRLLLNYISYVCSASINTLFFFIFKKYDCIIVHEPSPIFQAIPAIIFKKIKHTPIYLWVLDIWPDAMRSGGGIKNNYIIEIIDKIVIWIYKNSDKILISSRRFCESINSKGNFNHKLEYFPNWSDDMLYFNSSPIPDLPNGFVIMIAGNLGKSQDLCSVSSLILSLKDITSLKWAFIGDGSKKEWLDDFIKTNNLEKIAFTYGRYPNECMPLFYSKANAMLVSLKSGFPHLGMVVPARLQSYMSAGKPVLAMIGNGGADIIKESDCGYAVPAGDYNTLAKIIRNELLSNIEDFEKKGLNGRLYYEKNFTKQKCINSLCKIISNNNK